jgi:hypothetical protein
MALKTCEPASGSMSKASTIKGSDVVRAKHAAAKKFAISGTFASFSQKVWRQCR